MIGFKTGHVLHPFRSRLGLTLAETVVAMLIASMISLAVSGLIYATGISFKQLYSDTRARSTRMIALDQIRFRLSSARIGSVRIKNDGRRIDFSDPNLSGARSMFSFDREAGTLFYDDDIHDFDRPIEVAEGPIDLSFTLTEDGALVVLHMATFSDAKLKHDRIENGATSIYLRNV